MTIDAKPRPIAPTTVDHHAAALRPGQVDLSQRRGPSRLSRSRRIGHRALRVLVPLAILALWQIATSADWISPTVLASPLDVLEAAKFLWQMGDLQEALKVSLGRAFTGLALGVVIGLVTGVISGLWRLGEELLDATMQMIRTIPFIALIPLFVVWFGIGDSPKIILITVACSFSVYLNTFAGVRNVDAKLLEVGAVFGLSRRETITRLVLPNALPSILVGIRYSMGTSVLALVAAEQINAGAGLGYLIMSASAEIRTDIVILGVVIYALLGLVIDLFVRILQKVLLPWRPSILENKR